MNCMGLISLLGDNYLLYNQLVNVDDIERFGGFEPLCLDCQMFIIS
jgi:hypothetical protein